MHFLMCPRSGEVDLRPSQEEQQGPLAPSDPSQYVLCVIYRSKHQGDGVKQNSTESTWSEINMSEEDAFCGDNRREKDIGRGFRGQGM